MFDIVWMVFKKFSFVTLRTSKAKNTIQFVHSVQFEVQKYMFFTTRNVTKVT